jgi:adenylate kinase
VIIFMGVAGAGKSVQGKKLADELGLPWLSTGEFLRMLISGERRRDMVAGKLLEDQDIISLIQKVFSVVDSHNEFVLDGFPRTMAQADWLLNQVKHGQLTMTAVVHLKASEKEVTKRLLERARPDDTPAAIKERFTEYRQTVLPVIDHFKEAGVQVLDIDGEQPVAIIQKQILSAVKPLVLRNGAAKK